MTTGHHRIRAQYPVPGMTLGHCRGFAFCQSCGEVRGPLGFLRCFIHVGGLDPVRDDAHLAQQFQPPR